VLGIFRTAQKTRQPTLVSRNDPRSMRLRDLRAQDAGRQEFLDGISCSATARRAAGRTRANGL
jgi:hypothetical protein